MLNPVLSNTEIHFSSEFFPDIVTKKYDDFLHHKNTPLKSIKAHFLESIQNISTPGINLNLLAINAIANMKNTDINHNIPGSNGFDHTTVNKTYPGTDPLNNVIDTSIVTLQMRNSILNYMYSYEMYYRYYKRTRDVDDFIITIIMKDSAEIPLIHFNFRGCFVITLPGLEFSFSSAFMESKTIDIGFQFNSLDVDFVVPGFNLERIILK